MGGGGGGVVTGEEVEVEIFAKSKTNRESARAANWKCVLFSPASAGQTAMPILQYWMTIRAELGGVNDNSSPFFHQFADILADGHWETDIQRAPHHAVYLYLSIKLILYASLRFTLNS